MNVPATDAQLELFELSEQRPRLRPERFEWVRLHLRYDQLIIIGIGSLIGCTMVFAVGVERGKQLARSERVLLAHQEPVPPSASPSTPSRVTTKPAPPSTEEASEPLKAPAKPAPAQKVPTKSRYAVQVVTYTRAQLARMELERLQRGGETAFLVMRDGRTILYVGPFHLKADASEKLVTLKTKYRDCFIKTL